MVCRYSVDDGLQPQVTINQPPTAQGLSEIPGFSVKVTGCHGWVQQDPKPHLGGTLRLLEWAQAPDSLIRDMDQAIDQISKQVSNPDELTKNLHRFLGFSTEIRFFWVLPMV